MINNSSFQSSLQKKKSHRKTLMFLVAVNVLTKGHRLQINVK